MSPEMQEKYLKGLDFEFKSYLKKHGIPSIQSVKTPNNFSFLSIRVMPTFNPEWYNIDIAEIVPNQKLKYADCSAYFDQMEKSKRFSRSVCSIAKKVFCTSSEYFMNCTQYSLVRVEFQVAVHNKDCWAIYLKWPSIRTVLLSDKENGDVLSLEEIAEHEYQQTPEYQQIEEQLKKAGAYTYWTGGK